MRRARLIALELGVTALIVALVWRYAQTSDSLAVAKFSEIWRQFHQLFLFDRFSSDVLPTLRRVAIGFALSVLIGVLLGLALGHSRLLRVLTNPLLAFIRAVPPIALIPPAIILIGIEDNMKITLVTFVCLWPIALNTADGVAEIDQTLKDTTRTFRLTRWERLRLVTLPAIAPRVMAGMHISLALSMIVVIAMEYLIGTEGLGFVINQAQQSFLIAQMWAGVVMLALLGYLLNLGFTRTRDKLLYWLPKSESSVEEASA